MDREEVHQRLMTLEMETTRIRYTTFTTLLSVSLVLPGLAVQATGEKLQLTDTAAASLRSLVFLFGWIFGFTAFGIGLESAASSFILIELFTSSESFTATPSAKLWDGNCSALFLPS